MKEVVQLLNDMVAKGIVSALHLAVIALKTGRAKDHLRIVSLIEARAVDPGGIAQLAARHQLGAKWDAFCSRFL